MQDRSKIVQDKTISDIPHLLTQITNNLGKRDLHLTCASPIQITDDLDGTCLIG